MALTAAALATSVTWATTGTKTISFTCSAGDVLVIVVSATGATETFLNPTAGWTAGPDVAASAGDFRAVTYWKIADGSETSFSIAASTATGNMSGIKVTGWTGTATLEDSDENEANITGAGVTSISTNSASNTTADAAAIALFASDRWDSVETTRAYTNSFAETVAATGSGSRGGAWIAFKALTSGGANSTTFSCVDTGDQMYAAILVFGDVTGGGGITGSLAVTEADDTLSASGAVTVTGSILVTESADTLSSSGVVTVSGSLAVTEAADTLSASGVVSSGIDGTVAVTEANDTSAASGTVTSTGTINATEADDTLSAAGTVTISGTINVTELNDTCAASGVVGNFAVGTVDVSEEGDTCFAEGTVSGDVVISSALDGDVVSFAKFAAEVSSQARIQAQLNSYPRLSHAGIYSEAA